MTAAAPFSDDALVGGLSSLTKAQESIQGLSRWLVQNGPHAARAVAVWKAEFDNCLAAEKQLCFLYLVNDVLQTCRKDAPAYREEFAGILPSALSRFVASAPPALVAKAKRTVDVWRARNVLPGPTLAALTTCFPAPAAPAPAPVPATATTATAAPSAPPATPMVPAAFKPVLEAATRLEVSSVRLSLAQDTMGALTSTLFPLPDASTLDTSAREGLLLNLNAGLVALAEYKKHMETDLTDRSGLVQALQEMANAHSLVIEANATKLQECLEHIEAICGMVATLQQPQPPQAQTQQQSETHQGIQGMPSAGGVLKTKEEALAAAAAAVAALSSVNSGAGQGGVGEKRPAAGGPAPKRQRGGEEEGSTAAAAVPPASAAETQ